MNNNRYEEMTYITNIVKKHIVNALTTNVNDMPVGLVSNFMYLYEQRFQVDVWLRPYVCAMLLKQYGYLYKSNIEINVDIIPILVASELFNISTYQSNIVFDDKINNKSVNNVNQIISSFISFNLTTQVISSLNIDHQIKVDCINKLNQNNRLVYQGQYIDLNVLVTDNIDSIVKMSIEKYLELYMNRCKLIGGTTVENCAFWVCKIAHKDMHYIDRLCTLFSKWGQMMQMVNDLSDYIYILDKKYIRYTDVRAGKVTLPLYMILHSVSKDEAINIINHIPLQNDNDLNSIFEKYLYKDSAIIRYIYGVMKQIWNECVMLANDLQLDKSIISFMYENAFQTKYSRFFFSNKLIRK